MEMKVNGITNQNLSVEVVQNWQNKLHKLQTSCGCEVGILAMLFSVVLCVWYFGYGRGAIYSLQYKLITGSLTCFATALAGKVIGMAGNRYRYKVLRKQANQKGIA